MSDLTLGDPNQLMLQASFTSPNVYANGFSMTSNNVDVTAVCMWNGRPAAMLTMTMAAARALSAGLEQLVAQAEEQTGTEYLTLTEVGRRSLEFKQRNP